MPHTTTPAPRILTVPDLPHAIVTGQSQAGWDASNTRWHRTEADRRAAKGDHVFIRKNGGGRIHLAIGIPRPTDDIIYMPEVF